MADFHILSGDQNGNAFRVAFHIDIPSQNNVAGVNYQTALQEFLGQGDPTSIASSVPNLGTELSDLQAGILLEVVETFHSNPQQSEIEKRDALVVRHGELTTEKIAEYQNILSYWGYNYEIP